MRFIYWNGRQADSWGVSLFFVRSCLLSLFGVRLESFCEIEIRVSSAIGFHLDLSRQKNGEGGLLCKILPKIDATF